jgi:hypothetical protein
MAPRRDVHVAHLQRANAPRRGVGAVGASGPHNPMASLFHPRLPLEPILTLREKGELRHEVFRNRVLVGLDLSGADLRNARFEGTVLEACNLAGANLRGARFISCDVRSVDLTSVELGENDFRGTMLMDIVGLSEQDRSLIHDSGGAFQQACASLR